MRLPDTAVISVSSSLASDLNAAAATLPDYENYEYYDEDLQYRVFDHIRQGCKDGFGWLTESIRTRIQLAPYCVVVKGLSFDHGYALLVALNRAFGRLVARHYDQTTPRAQLIHHIQPGTDKIAGSGKLKLSEFLHVDGAERPIPFRYLSMLCIRPDAHGGGRSALLDIDAVRKLVSESDDRSLLHFVQEQQVPWLLGDYVGGGVAWSPILQPDKLRWRRYTIDDALELPDVSLSDMMLRQLDAFEALVANAEDKIEFSMGAQELLIIDNWRCLHARTPIPNVNTDRLMLRVWVEDKSHDGP